jgi:hypothetical protein
MRAVKESVTSDKNQDGRGLKRVGVGVRVVVVLVVLLYDLE